jgi:hypothetical protein
MNSCKIYYNFETAAWEAPESKQLLFGHFQEPLNELNNNGTKLSFHVRENNGKVGPLIGVLIGETRLNSPIGNTGLIKALTIEAFKQGAILFSFTPKAVNETMINGFLYHPKYNEWLKMTFPIPDVIYNRTPYRSEEQNQDTMSMVDWIRTSQIPFFNQHFFCKNEVYHVLAKHPVLHKHIPTTTIFQSFKQLKETLDIFSRIYVKPSTSHKGDGIFTLEKTLHSSYIFKSNHTTQEFSHYDRLSTFLRSQMKIELEYLLQEHIEKEAIEGCAFDLRVIAHHFHKQWNVTGVGIRCAAPGNVTTHVPSGGKIIYEEMLPIEINHELISQLVIQCGEQLDDHFGPIKEFSLDIGIDTNGDYWIFEANSRPMSFDEPHIKSMVPVNLMKAILDEQTS